MGGVKRPRVKHWKLWITNKNEANVPSFKSITQKACIENFLLTTQKLKVQLMLLVVSKNVDMSKLNETGWCRLTFS